MDLRTTYIIDATEAINNLNRLQGAFTRTNAAIGAVSGAGGTQAFSGVSRGATSARAAVQRLTTETLSATGASNGLLVSWQTLTRVVATQAIVSTLGAIRAGFAGAVTEAAELQRQVALISTLQSEVNGRTTNDILQGQVLDVSNDFGIGAVQAAEAAYNALSNQVGTLSQTFQFTAEAAQFASATNSTLTDSVDLLSAAQIGYDRTVEQTAETSSAFFAIIDEGRITASELANTFGRIGAPANQLGVDFSELGAALANISQDGFRTSETLTQFRGIVNGLSRPTTELSAAITQIGFESAQSAVQSVGLIRTLQLLQETTDGNNEAFFRLFPNVRGSTGVLSLLGRDADDLTASFERLQDSSSTLARERALDVLDTDGQVLNQTFNRLQNETLEVGEAILGLGADLVRFAGGPEQAAEAVTNLAVSFGTVLTVGLAIRTALAGVTAAMAALTTTTSAGATAQIAFQLATTASERALAAKALAAVAARNATLTLNLAAGAAAVGIGLLVAAIGAIRAARLEELIGEQNRALEQSEGIIDNARVAFQGLRRDAVNDLNASARATAGFIARIEADFSRQIGRLNQQNGELRNSTEGTFQALSAGREEYLQGLRDITDTTDSDLAASTERVEDLQDALRELSRIDATPTQQVENLLNDATRDLNQGLLNLNSTDRATNEQGIQDLADARAAGERAVSLAQSTGDQRVVALAVERLREILERQVSAEGRLTEIIQARDAEAEEALAESPFESLRAANEPTIAAIERATDRQVGTLRELLSALNAQNQAETDLERTVDLRSDAEVQQTQAESDVNQTINTLVNTIESVVTANDSLRDRDPLATSLLESLGVLNSQEDVESTANTLRTQLILAQSLGRNAETQAESTQAATTLTRALRDFLPFLDSTQRQAVQDAQEDFSLASQRRATAFDTLQNNPLPSQQEFTNIQNGSAARNTLEDALGQQFPTEVRAEIIAEAEPVSLEEARAQLSQPTVAEVVTRATLDADGVIQNSVQEQFDNGSEVTPRLAPGSAEAAADEVSDAFDRIEISPNTDIQLPSTQFLISPEDQAVVNGNQDEGSTVLEDEALVRNRLLSDISFNLTPQQQLSNQLAANQATSSSITNQPAGQQRGPIPSTLSTLGRVNNIRPATFGGLSSGGGRASLPPAGLPDSPGFRAPTGPGQAPFVPNFDPEAFENFAIALRGDLEFDPAQVFSALETATPEFLQTDLEIAEPVEAVIEPVIDTSDSELNLQGSAQIPIEPELSTTAAAGVVQNIQQTLDGGAFTIRVTPQLVASGGAITRQFGGPLFLQNGTTGARGVDSIPALLAPGESVINSRDTSRFFSQIQAINAGQNPSFRQNSGNTTVGDINVNLTTSQPINTQQGRTLARAIRQEFRRGTSSL